MLSKMCFQQYNKPFTQCAMITEAEFLLSLEEFMAMTTKFVQFFGDLPFFGQHATVMQNLGIPSAPSTFQDISARQVLEQGVPILQAKTFASGELGVGIDWMCMLLMLGISGSARIDQQVAKNVSSNLTATLFNKIPFNLYPYNVLQLKEFNPHQATQEIIPLVPAAQRPGGILRPNNLLILNDSAKRGERTLLPACELASHLMLEDYGWTAPYYNLCELMGIKSTVYDLPIDLVAWPAPYPIDVRWPVIRYGEHPSNRKRDRGYLHVSSKGGKAKLVLYGRGVNMPAKSCMLASVHDAAVLHCMGPRPLFSTPFRGVLLSKTEIGVLMPMVRHPSGEHPASRYYNALSDTYRVWSPANLEEVDKDTSWVEEHVLPMSTSVLIKAWAPSAERLSAHLGRGVGRVSSAQRSARLQQYNVHILARIVPPRDVHTHGEACVWVGIEVRHTAGFLRGVPRADMVSVKVPAEDLVPMPSQEDADIVPFNRLQVNTTSNRGGGGAAAAADEGSSKKRRRDASRGDERAEDESDSMQVDGGKVDSHRPTVVVCDFVYSSTNQCAATQQQQQR
jgi:hypothetical protein